MRRGDVRLFSEPTAALQDASIAQWHTNMLMDADGTVRHSRSIFKRVAKPRCRSPRDLPHLSAHFRQPFAGCHYDGDELTIAPSAYSAG